MVTFLRSDGPSRQFAVEVGALLRREGAPVPAAVTELLALPPPKAKREQGAPPKPPPKKKKAAPLQAAPAPSLLQFAQGLL